MTLFGSPRAAPFTTIILSKMHNNMTIQGCHGQGKKSGKQIFFQVREKSGNFNFSQGNLEKMIKVREFEKFPKKSIGKKVLQIIISSNCK